MERGPRHRRGVQSAAKKKGACVFAGVRRSGGPSTRPGGGVGAGVAFTVIRPSAIPKCADKHRSGPWRRRIDRDQWLFGRALNIVTTEAVAAVVLHRGTTHMEISVALRSLQTPGGKHRKRISPPFRGLRVLDGDGLPIPVGAANSHRRRGPPAVRSGGGPRAAAVDGLPRLFGSLRPGYAGRTKECGPAIQSERDREFRSKRLRIQLVFPRFSARGRLGCGDREAPRLSSPGARSSGSMGCPRRNPAGGAQVSYFSESRDDGLPDIQAQGGIWGGPRSVLPAGTNPRRTRRAPRHQFWVTRRAPQRWSASLAVNPRMVIFGEDVGQKKAEYTAANAGLGRRNSARHECSNTSLSEEGIIGRGRGYGPPPALMAGTPRSQFRKYADPARRATE